MELALYIPTFSRAVAENATKQNHYQCTIEIKEK